MFRKVFSVKSVGMFIVIGSLLLAACAPRAARRLVNPSVADASANRGQLKVEFVGQLESLSARSAKVNGTRLIIDEHTAVTPGLAANQIVHAATVLRAGDLAALSIEPAAQGQAPGGSFELTGVLESQTATVWTIGGQAVQVGTAAEIKGSPALGTTVKAEGSLNASGELVAREIRAIAADEVTPEATETKEAELGSEVEFTGTVTSMASDSWTIGGKTVAITLETEIKGDPQVGDVVKVEAKEQADGSLVAHEIEAEAQPEPTATPGPQMEFTGTVTSIAADMWTIGGSVVRVTGETEIKGDPKVGDVVKVEARAGTDGVLVAEEIKLATSGDDHTGMGDDQDNDGDHEDVNDQNDDGEHSGIDDHSGSDSGGSTVGSGGDDHSGSDGSDSGGDDSGGGDHHGGDDGGGDHSGGGDD